MLASQVHKVKYDQVSHLNCADLHACLPALPAYTASSAVSPVGRALYCCRLQHSHRYKSIIDDTVK